MKEFCKCRFCYYYNGSEHKSRCNHWDCCSQYENFEWVTDRLIEKAKEKGISVTDVIALIEIDSGLR